MKIQYCSEEKGYGVFANSSFPKGSVIHTLTGTELDNPSRESIRVVINRTVKHIVDEYGKFMNHSFEPTCIINKGNIVALVDIYPNTELTFNYNENEVDMAAPFIYNGVIINGKKIDK